MGKEFSGPHRACPNVGAQKPKQCQHNPGSTTTDESVAKVFGILGATIIRQIDIFLSQFQPTAAENRYMA